MEKSFEQLTNYRRIWKMELVPSRIKMLVDFCWQSPVYHWHAILSLVYSTTRPAIANNGNGESSFVKVCVINSVSFFRFRFDFLVWFMSGMKMIPISVVSLGAGKLALDCTMLQFFDEILTRASFSPPLYHSPSFIFSAYLRADSKS